MPLNLSDIEKNYGLLTFEILLPSEETVILRPLRHADAKLLTEFLESLSAQTRKFYTLDNYNLSTAKKLCDAINKYDKLRFVVVNKSTEQLIALFEYSFDIPDGDKKRFLKYNIQLDSKIDCRMGFCISDSYQNSGIGSALFPHLIDIARQFGQKRLILWGGVFEKNKKAINFYIKNGFKKLGSFQDPNGEESVDMIIDVR